MIAKMEKLTHNSLILSKGSLFHTQTNDADHQWKLSQ